MSVPLVLAIIAAAMFWERCRHAKRTELLWARTVLERHQPPPSPARLLSISSGLFAAAHSRDELLAEGLRQLTQHTADHVSHAALALRVHDSFDVPIVRGPFSERLRPRLRTLFEALLYADQRSRLWSTSRLSIENFAALGIDRWLFIPCRDGDETVAALWLGLRGDRLDVPLEVLNEIELLGECFASALRAALRVAEERDRSCAHFDAFSHDLRSPSVNALLMVRELQHSATTRPADRLLLQHIEGCLHRQLALIGAALSARHNNQQSSPVALPVAPLVERLCNEHQLAATAGGLSLASNVPPTVAVLADAQQLLRILDNLISNAIRYSKGRRVNVTAGVQSGLVRICVEDDGIGIPASERSTLFTRSTCSPNSVGFGIGLAGASELARANGGTLEFYPGMRGACFVLTLPAAASSKADVYQSALIVDDVPAVARTLGRYLAGAVQEIRTAESLKEAERELAAKAPELLLTDWRIGESSAEPLIRRFAASAPPSARIVLITGTPNSPTFDRLSSRYNLSVLTKPVSREALLSAISRSSSERTPPSHPRISTGRD